MLLLSDIKSAEQAMENVNNKLESIGRDIYKMRFERDLEPEYTFQDYSLESFALSKFFDTWEPNWGPGTPIICLCFYKSDQSGGYEEYITFPQSWLGQDWRAWETSRLETVRAQAKESQQRYAEHAAKQQEDEERATYERLKAKYGD